MERFVGTAVAVIVRTGTGSGTKRQLRLSHFL